MQALGGAKNHAIVLPDADLDFAADHLVAAAFGSAGRALHGDLRGGRGRRRRRRAGGRLVAAKAGEVMVGSGRDPDSEMGPVVTAAARDRIVGLIGTGRASRAPRSLVDGRGLKVAGHEDGFFVGPTADRPGRAPRWTSTPRRSSARCCRWCARDTVDEAIALINANPYGNGTAIFTCSGEAARRFQRGVQVGMIGINVPIPVPMAYYSFGGWKDSLFGDKHIHGPEGVSFYTRGKVVTSRWPHVEAAPRRLAALPDGELTGDACRKLQLGSCPDSWGVWFADDPRQTPWQRFLDELAGAGYRWLELGPYGYLPTDPAQLQDELAKRDLTLRRRHRRRGRRPAQGLRRGAGRDPQGRRADRGRSAPRT